MKRLKGFTIVELVVSMLISAIVIGIVYNSFLFFNGQFRSYQLRSSTMQQYFLFEKSINIDFERAAAITDPEPGIIVLDIPDASEKIIYEINNGGINRRVGEIIDSFPLKNNGANIVYVNDGSRLIQKINIDFMIDNAVIGTTVSKKYSAMQLMSAK
jgi:prepilin-type N-terminal cleavage/methylation domain-containing protein